jgi:IS1 family transposase
VDELWAYVGKKEKRLQPSDGPDLGDSYTFLGIDANRKAIVSFVVGKRDYAHTAAFCKDLRARVVNRPQISSDGFHPYAEAVQRAFGHDVDYAQVRKTYGPISRHGTDPRFSPRRCTGSVKVVVTGDPAPGKISTSYVERVNLSLRMGTKRFERKTNGFSKKMRNHAAAVALYIGHYNFCRVHETLRTTPMVAIGVTDHVWSIAELLDAALSIAPAPAAAAPGPSLDPGQVVRPADLPPIAPALPSPAAAPLQLSLFPEDGARSGRVWGKG